MHPLLWRRPTLLDGIGSAARADKNLRVDTNLRLHADGAEQSAPRATGHTDDLDGDLKSSRSRRQGGGGKQGCHVAAHTGNALNSHQLHAAAPNRLLHPRRAFSASGQEEGHAWEGSAGSSIAALKAQGKKALGAVPASQLALTLTLGDTGGQGGGSSKIVHVALRHRAVGLGEVLHRQARERHHKHDLRRGGTGDQFLLGGWRMVIRPPPVDGMLMCRARHVGLPLGSPSWASSEQLGPRQGSRACWWGTRMR